MQRICETGFQNRSGKPGLRQMHPQRLGNLVLSMRRMVALQAGLLLVAMLASAAPQKNTMRIKVLDSETRSSSLDDSGVPNNCEQLTFDAYCRSSRTAPLVNTLLVQEDDKPPFRISCTTESRYSRCTPLPKGATLDARREKHGITVYYEDDKGKARNQLYTFVNAGGKASPTAAAAAVAPPQSLPPPAPAPSAAAPPQNSPSSAPAPLAAAPTQNSSAPAPVPPPASAQGVLKAKVKCNFTSTPSGAEITIDWRYVGNTPSEISLSTGTHIVVLSLPGFAEWKRELAVVADSVVNVTATLEKTQP